MATRFLRVIEVFLSAAGRKKNRLGGLLVLVTIAAMVLPMEGTVTESIFGNLPDGRSVEIYTLQDGALKVRVMSYGARMVSVEAPDRSGKTADIVLGYGSLAPYLTDKTYFGAIVGRYANRIARGEFPLDGKTYHVVRNDDGNSLHGGAEGFDRRLWSGHSIPGGVEFTLVSPDGDQGYPGRLAVRVRYTLQHQALRIESFATTDKDTVVNLTNHSYFNLAGEGVGDILGNLVTIAGSRYTPVDASLIPTGQIAPVEGTPLDFRKPMVAGARIREDNQQLRLAGGYDFNWVLDGRPGQLAEAARVVEPRSGRVLTVSTTQPGLQFYTANSLDGVHGKHGHIYGKYSALCLETQHFPDSPNHPNFPSTELKPGETYHSVTVFAFSTEPGAAGTPRSK